MSLKSFIEKESISRFEKSFHLIGYMYQDVEMGAWKSWKDISTYINM